MRDIKFRCWDRVKKVMLPPDDMGYQIQMPNGDYFDADVYYLQYTGLKDINGKEIYEGDIIKSVSFNERKLCTVIFKDGSFVKFNDCVFSSSTHGLGFHKDNEVIGNIYENPTLLEPKPTVL